jgi:hypothetical protein
VKQNERERESTCENRGGRKKDREEIAFAVADRIGSEKIRITWLVLQKEKRDG